MERMQWVAELFDKISGPAKRISRSLNDFYTGMHQGRNSLGQFTEKQDSLRTQLNALQGPLGWATAGILAMGTAAAALGFKIGETAFTNFAFKESALATGKALWGSAEAADEMFKKASNLAKLTPFNVGQVVGGFNKLGAAGFSAEEVPVVFQGLADIASMSGRGAEAIDSMGLAFSQIMGKGHLAGQELNQITEAAGGAVSRMKLFKQIAGIMGVAEDSIDSMMEQGLVPARVAIMGVMQVAKGLGDGIMGVAEDSIDSMMEQGLVPARVAIMGVMQVAKGLGGGIIGQNSIEQSKTLGGLWSNLEDSVTNLWLTMDIANAPWFKAVKTFMGGLIDALDTGSQSGKVLQGVFDRLFSKTIGGFIGDGSQNMTDTIIELALAFEHMADLAIAAFQGMWDGLKEGFGPMLEMLGYTADSTTDAEGMRKAFHGVGVAVASLATGIITLTEGLSTLAGYWDIFKVVLNPQGAALDGTAAKLIGEMMGTGVKQGIDNSMPAASDAMVAHGEAMNADFQDLNDMHSPSRLWEEYGQNIVEGLNNGIASVPTMSSMLASDLAAGAGGRGAGTGAGGAVSVALTINMNGSNGEGADSTAQRIADVTTSTLASFFDQLAAERGLA